jgi:miniconductance mechanosensitive channel
MFSYFIQFCDMMWPWEKSFADQLIEAAGYAADDNQSLYLVLSLFLLGAGCWILWAFTRLVIIRLVKRIITKTNTLWDDRLYEHRVFRNAAMILIAVVVCISVPHVFRYHPTWMSRADAVSKMVIVLTVMFACNAILNALVSILEATEKFSDKPIRSYKQVTKIVIYLVGIVMILAFAIGQSPLYILGGFGAVTAILLLVFRDPILGFVASIQMSAIDLVRIGDWITVDKYGADGEVFEINLTTVKVRNFDMTVTIVPSYALVSESFRNWRGMDEGEGRRIKRHLNIKISSIRYCDEELFNKLLKVQRIRPYLEQKKAEIDAHNSALGLSKDNLIDGRQLTNIGIFRKYAFNYLEQNPYINTSMTFMVRQLQPNENGLPIEVYAFSKEKRLEDFEAVAADIFDHLLAAVPFFDLEIFQSPSGSDFRQGLNEENQEDPMGIL